MHLKLRRKITYTFVKKIQQVATYDICCAFTSNYECVFIKQTKPTAWVGLEFLSIYNIL